jgi:hypothetical protein
MMMMMIVKVLIKCSTLSYDVVMTMSDDVDDDYASLI